MPSEDIIKLSLLLNAGGFGGNSYAGIGTSCWTTGIPQDFAKIAKTDSREYLKKNINERLKTKRTSKSALNENTNMEIKNTWDEIAKEYKITKRQYGRKINFITDDNVREIIFRDTGHAYCLAKQGYDKAAVILAGGIIEELLRTYLRYKGYPINNQNFNSLLEICIDNHILHPSTHSLSNAVREFRNLVHIDKEIKERISISPSVAIGAIATIFSIVNNFEQ